MRHLRIVYSSGALVLLALSPSVLFAQQIGNDSDLPAENTQTPDSQDLESRLRILEDQLAALSVQSKPNPKEEESGTVGLEEITRIGGVLLIFAGFMLNGYIFVRSRIDRRFDMGREVSSFWLQESVSKPAMAGLKQFLKFEDKRISDIEQLSKAGFVAVDQSGEVESELTRFTANLDKFRRSFVELVSVFDEKSYGVLSKTIENFEDEFTQMIVDGFDGRDYPTFASGRLSGFRSDIVKSLLSLQGRVLADRSHIIGGESTPASKYGLWVTLTRRESAIEVFKII